MRKLSIFRPNGWDRLEVRITPSAIGHVAAEIVRIDAHVQLAKVHHARQNGHHVNHQGGSVGGGSVLLGPVTPGYISPIGLGSTDIVGGSPANFGGSTGGGSLLSGPLGGVGILRGVGLLGGGGSTGGGGSMGGGSTGGGSTGGGSGGHPGY